MMYQVQEKEFKFNHHVCMELLLGIPDEKRTGRLVQVRKGVGAFGSDLLLIRLRNGGLGSFENALIRAVNDKEFETAFYTNNGKNVPEIPRQIPYKGDTPETEYTINGKWPETGFIIDAPNQPSSDKHSFAMMVTNDTVILNA